MFQRLGGTPDNLIHLDRIEALVRARFALPSDQIVLVSEDPCTIPGFPPRDTTVRFWTDRETRYRLRIFKPAAKIGAPDLPVAWLLPSLIDDGDPDCC
jgi:hypothetical protein